MEFGTVIDMEEEKMEEKEKAMAMSPAPTATIKLDGWWNHPERHGGYGSTGERSAGASTAEGRTHREPDSFELIAREMGMDAYDYCEEYGIGYSDDDDPAEYSMHSDLVRRMEAVAARG